MSPAARDGRGAVAAPPWPLRWARLVRALAPVHSPQQEDALLDLLARPDGPTVLAFLNAHALNAAAGDARFFQHLLSADHLLRDGSGLSLLLRLLRRSPGANLNGTDLIPRLLRRHDGARIALLGTREPWLSQARDHIALHLAPQARLDTADGFRPVEDYVRLVAQHRPALVVLAMGMPRQEAVAQALRASASWPCLVVCGGAILDFLGGRHPRAPRWLQRLGLEWCWRLAREPRRLFRRYVVGNPVFVARALHMALSHERQATGGSRAP